MSSRPELRLDWCSYAAAKYAVEHWHYSGRMPSSKIVQIGCWEDGVFIGTMVVGIGASDSLVSPYGLSVFQISEIQRIALRAHRSPVSRILRFAIKMVRSHSPGLRMLISYADPFYGHHGAIYQAANWVYTGLTAPDTMLRTPDGRLWHSRGFSSSGRKKQWGRYVAVPTRADGEIIHLPGKHRYLYPLDDGMRTCVEPLAQPYPKRQKDSSEPPGHRPGEGGAAPTLTLQHYEVELGGQKAELVE